MKKLITAILAAALLAGCGKDESEVHRDKYTPFIGSWENMDLGVKIKPDSSFNPLAGIYWPKYIKFYKEPNFTHPLMAVGLYYFTAELAPNQHTMCDVDISPEGGELAVGYSYVGERKFEHKSYFYRYLFEGDTVMTLTYDHRTSYAEIDPEPVGTVHRYRRVAE